jgi:hypothetical protein
VSEYVVTYEEAKGASPVPQADVQRRSSDGHAQATPPPELVAFLAEPNPSVIATVRPDGSPHTAAGGR